MQRSTIRNIATIAALLFLATVYSIASPVTASFAGLGGASQNGEYIYPYFVTIDNGPQIPMVCDDIFHASAIGDTWDANITALSSHDMSNTRFQDYAKYVEAGFLLQQIAPANQAEWGNINWAIWKIFNPGINPGPDPEGTLGVAYWYDLALGTNLETVNVDFVMILTPVDAQSETGDQEFMYLTPEPGTLLLAGSGLLALFSARKRFI